MKILKIAGIVVVALVALLVGAVLVRASTGDAKLRAPQTPYPQIAASTDPAVIERGRYLVRTVAHCTQCHGDYPRAQPAGNTPDVPLAGGFEFAMGPMGTTWASNLTPDPDTGIGKRTDGELARAIATGVLPDGRISIFMRYSAANLSHEDLTAVVSYLRALPPTKRPVPVGDLTTMGKAVFSFFDVRPDVAPLPAHVPDAAEPSLQRGAYLADHVALCTTCHTKLDMTTFALVGPKAGGGLPEPSHGDDRDKEFVAPNLTAHPTGITGKLDEDAFVARMQAGRVFPSSIMPWENLARMNDADLRSIYRYLQSLPPIDNDVGPTYRDVGWQPAG